MPPLSSPSLDTSSRAQLLSNGRYTVMLNAVGSGYSEWRGLAITRWREEPVGDSWGSYLLLRDEESGETWSPTLQPYGIADGIYANNFCDGHVSMTCQQESLIARLDIAVASDRDMEWRRVTLSNSGERARRISLTSYAELVLGPAGADAAHPAFSKMFVQTEWVEQDGILLATRRRRSPGEPELWAAHRAVAPPGADNGGEYESDRMRFLGRGRTLRHAHAMQASAVLSGTHGSVLDAVFSVRRQVRVAAGASVQVTFLTALANSRADVLALIRSLGDRVTDDDILAGAAAYARNEQVRLGIDAYLAERFDGITAALLHATSAFRSITALLERGVGGAPVLWSCGISGDRPIILLRITHSSDMTCVEELLLAQRYWHAKQLGIDLVVLEAGDRDGAALHVMLSERVGAQNDWLKGHSAHIRAQAFVLRHNETSDTVRNGLATAARIVVDAATGLPDSVTRRRSTIGEMPARFVQRASGAASVSRPVAAIPAGEFDNGLGCFSSAGRSYTVTLQGGRSTPSPWVNVIANAGFGFLVSAEGGGYTWSSNSQQNPLTPWPNDPVSDVPSEVLYLRDKDSGQLWSATAAPIRVANATYLIEHGKGYSRFSHTAHGIEVDLLQFVPTHDPIKLSRLRLRNGSSRKRRLSITAYVAWALGANGTVPAPFVSTSRDAVTGALFACNRWRTEFSDRVAFMDFGGLQRSMTGSRLEFLGRLGAVDSPLALIGNSPLSGRLGAGLDPCGALQSAIELVPGEQIDLRLMLGEALEITEARLLVQKYRVIDLDAVLDDVRSQWCDLLDTVQVTTPDRAMDILLNDWLLYQALGCRMWARTAYYQASGAYGFRDQLQDAMSLCVARPDLAREHLLRATARQFVQGDVQHWWLPPSGQGIRTRISDDRIWLAYVAAHYVTTTGDHSVLDEIVPFLDGPLIKDGDTDAFYQPSIDSERGSVYDHAARAIDSGMTLGAHGFPLMGTGDWNDGMNNVGAEGRGESTWLAWFLLSTIRDFLPYARVRGEQLRVDRWQAYAASLQNALNGAAGWDGEWYRRGYYDDGTPLGSNGSEECKIDVIVQSWSLMSGAADPIHAVQAMNAVDKYLIRDDEQIALLFTPPFDHTPLNPGYIKGYPPGMRENGGQYTHGATWSIFAYTMLGQGDRAAKLFDILNPIRRTETADAVARYRVEPYVACADVYSESPHIGRGGWTWYTGSAGWLYRAGLEAILGFQRLGGHLRINPCIPKSWPRFDIIYRHRGGQHGLTRYVIAIENPDRVNYGVALIELDGETIGTNQIPLVDDGCEHHVYVRLG
ncbi:Cellobiose phosphorylase [Dyella sp. AD56]|uniref:GH36-type glycosyl hydrolase domain-containing protein n=1 Tax=Dyella sp. AD56 TaxID=1528744 RepID=UPI000C82DD30|nr:glycosyl transferase family 36 [Dyella sp. AD56]PMQ03554.1 Cellobiose phosphorylase [Dyella sp. AD56]